MIGSILEEQLLGAISSMSPYHGKPLLTPYGMSDAARKTITEQRGVAVAQVDDQEYAFRFVEVSEPSQGRGEDRSVIRSHVMRDYYGKRDQRRKHVTLPLLSPALPKSAGPQTQRFKVGPQGLQEVKKRRKKTRNVSGKLPSVAIGSAAIETSAIACFSTPHIIGTSPVYRKVCS